MIILTRIPFFEATYFLTVVNNYSFFPKMNVTFVIYAVEIQVK